MSVDPQPIDASATPPSFHEASNLRQRSRAAGLDPDYWYAAELARNVPPGSVREVVFWGRSIALFRSSDGTLNALDNHCAHRQVKLSRGEVEGSHLVCLYHGWAYDGEGRVARIPHELFGRSMPRFCLRAYPVRERYGLLWIFPGDPARAPERSIPDIPELEGPGRWACIPLVFTWNAHHSMIIDNVSDFTHAHLHRRYRPFLDARLTRCETIGERVHVEYDTRVGGGRVTGLFVDRKAVDTSHIELCYEYPYQWSNTDDQIKHWLFVLPVGPRTTRAFFLFYFKSFKVPLLPVRIPRLLMAPLLRAANRFSIRPLLDQDGMAVEAEQEGYDAAWAAAPAELSPAVRAFQQLTVRSWESYLERTQP